MKKLTACILTLACLLGLAACKQSALNNQAKPAEPIAPQQLPTHSCDPFAQYLDDKEFGVGTSQKNLISQAEQYTYDGKSVSEHVPGMFWDGPNGGGLDMIGELFGFFNDFTASDDNTYADHSNCFYTRVPLEGLTLPYGISFEDTAVTALQKMGFDIKARDVKKIPIGTMILCNEGNSFLELTKSESGQYAYVLKYEENYQATRLDGRATNLTRTVTMSFSTESSQLGLFEMSVSERYKLDQDN